MIPVRAFMPPGARKSSSGERYEGSLLYDENEAPCICVSRTKHRDMHKFYDGEEAKQESRIWKYKNARDVAVSSVMRATEGKTPPCKKECIEAQINGAHRKMGIEEGTDLRANKYGPAPKTLHIVPPGEVPDGGDV